MADDAVPVRVGDLLETLEVIPLEFNTDKYPHGVKSIIATDSIFISENELAFFPPGITNYIYSYNLNTQAIEKAYRIDYGSDGIAESDLRSFSDDKERLKYEIMNTNKTLPLKTMQSGNRIIIILPGN